MEQYNATEDMDMHDFMDIALNDGTEDDDTASETSTIRFEHEPFEAFQEKVKVLVTNKFGADKIIQITHVKGGSYNRVVAADISCPKPTIFSKKWAKTQLCGLLGRMKSPESEAYIIRIPRHEQTDEEMVHDVAVLKAIDSQLDLPIPKVVSYDSSENNILESPYMIQKRLPGENLSKLWVDLNLEQKMSVVRRYTDLVGEIATVEGAPGNISLRNMTSPVKGLLHTDKYPVQDRGIIPSTLQSPFDHLLERCERWRQYQTEEEGYCFEDTWNGFVAIIKGLKKRGFLEGPCVLTHGDFQFYNLLAKTTNNTEVEITGVLDWDYAVVAPEFMAYRAPFWLWIPEDMDSCDDDNEDNANIEPTCEVDKQLKELFLSCASEKYKLYAFAPEAMLARRLYPILQGGIFSTGGVREADSIIREWHELHPEDGVMVEEDLDSDDE